MIKTIVALIVLEDHVYFEVFLVLDTLLNSLVFLEQYLYRDDLPHDHRDLESA